MKTLIIALVLSFACVNAGSAQQSVMLLGTRGCDSCGYFKTYMLVNDGGNVSMRAESNRLLVPRKDGFWWLDASSGASAYGMYAPEHENTAVCDTTTAEPATPQPEEEAEEHGISSVIRLTRVAAPAKTDSIVLYEGSLDINFVGNDWIAITEETTDRTEHGHASIYLLHFDSITHSSDYPQGGSFDASIPILQPGLKRCITEMGKAYRQGGGGYAIDAAEVDKDWVIVRRRTRWSLEVLLDANLIEGLDAYTGCAMPLEVATKFTGFDKVTVPWHEVKRVLPGATTAFESPAHDVVYVVQDLVLYAFVPQQNKLGTAVFSMKIDGKPVMSQWAVGAHAARWRDTVMSVSSKRVPPSR